MPARQIPSYPRTGAHRAGRQTSRQKINSILSRRERLVGELALLRQHGAASKFIDNAQQLLTRWWSGTTWDAREELLKSADWLLRLEKRHGSQTERSS
ncbi:MAG: hypothetical protein ACJ8DY_22205 [Xanthobacteraceae bacterium]